MFPSPHLQQRLQLLGMCERTPCANSLHCRGSLRMEAVGVRFFYGGCGSSPK